jgi:hypothetical protein
VRILLKNPLTAGGALPFVTARRNPVPEQKRTRA